MATKTIPTLNGGATRKPVPANAPVIPYSEGGIDYPSSLAQLRQALFSGCRVYLTTDPTAMTASTTVTLLFGSEDYDTDAFHDTSTNTSRLAIPTGLGIKYVDVSASILRNNTASAQFNLVIRHFNSTATQLRQWATNQNTTGYQSASVTALGVPVSDGDYFTVTYYSESTVTGLMGGVNGSSFTIKAVG